MHGPIPTPTAMLIVMSWTGQLYCELHCIVTRDVLVIQYWQSFIWSRIPWIYGTKAYEVLSLTLVFNQSRSDTPNKYLNNFFTYVPCVSVSLHFRISKRNYVRKLKLPILLYSSLCRPICKLYLWPRLWISKDVMTFWGEEKLKYFFLPINPGFPKQNCFLQGSQFSLTCPSDKRSTSVESSVELWRKMLRGQNRSIRRKACSIETLSTTNITWSDLESNRGSAVSGRRLTAWAWQAFEEKSFSYT
jgi:hypothetical protein